MLSNSAGNLRAYYIHPKLSWNFLRVYDIYGVYPFGTTLFPSNPRRRSKFKRSRPPILKTRQTVFLENFTKNLWKLQKTFDLTFPKFQIKIWRNAQISIKFQEKNWENFRKCLRLGIHRRYCFNSAYEKRLIFCHFHKTIGGISAQQ